MQPRELIIQGLTSFHDRVVLDFSDVSLFALVGPTGAGKSSVVDAITLALYGRIPRLHANEIAPAISTDAGECTVGLTFTVRGRPYRAVRTIRRTKTGASTIEAVLEQLNADGMVLATLAGTADDLTAEVERLVGLTFSEFTRAVVLPQGDFARVLRAQPKERQSLLSRLLGVGVYDRVKQRAGAHARSAQERAEQTSHQIHQLGSVTAEQVRALDADVERLDVLVAALAEDATRLQAIRDAFRDRTDAVKAADERLRRVQAVQPPPAAIRDLADQLALARASIEKASQAVEEIEAKVEPAEERVPAPAVLDDLRHVITLHGRTAEREGAVASATAALEESSEIRGQVRIALTRATEEVATATTDQARLHRSHAAVQAAQGLHPGDDCPVCNHELTDDAPALAADVERDTAALAAAAEELTRATRKVGTLQAQAARAETDIARHAAALQQTTDVLAAHRRSLEGRPSAAQAQLALDRTGALQQQITDLRAEGRAARDDLGRAQREHASLEEQASGVAATLDRTRLSVAELQPPAATGQPIADWEALHRWAVDRVPAFRQATEAARVALEEVTARGSALREKMDAACVAAGVPHSAADPRDRTVQHRADLRANAERLRAMLEMADNLRRDEADAREQALIGAELARLLRTDQFQRWLLDEATTALVAGASTKLRALSSGRYELRLDGRSGSIEVADLSSAGAPRSVRTLSGGETFLASLALALSLAEQIAVSASGPVALESLFIDEGFGSLDPETLDIAAGAIEQLGAGDRTIGVITHVAEMAERLPTRFIVQRTAAGSGVSRVDL